jgi:hypothetical protein
MSSEKSTPTMLSDVSKDDAGMSLSKPTSETAAPAEELPFVAVAAPSSRIEGPTEINASLPVFLAAAVPTPANCSNELREALTTAAVSLLESTRPQDALAQVGSSLLVALNLAGLDCLARAAYCSDGSPARELNLRFGIKVGSVVSDLMKTLDSRNGSGRQRMSVGTVNVESGGRAIVGNIGAPATPTASAETRATEVDEKPSVQFASVNRSRR